MRANYQKKKTTLKKKGNPSKFHKGKKNKLLCRASHIHLLKGVAHDLDFDSRKDHFGDFFSES